MKSSPSPALFALVIASAFFHMPPPASATLVAWYTFDGTVADQTGQHPGTVVGTANYVPGVAGQALNFTLTGGQYTYVELANPATINFGNDFSVALWLKTTGQGQQDFLTKNVTNTWAYPGKQFMTWGQQLLADINSSGDFFGNFSGDGINISDGQWHHVVLTYSATICCPQWAWYVDGYEQNSDGADFATGLDTATQHLRIGAREAGAGVNFIGQMDDFQIYDQTLTPAQAQYLYQNPGSTITNPPANGFTNTGTLFPRAAAQASTNISTFSYAGLSTSDLFMMLTFQGCINRVQPRIYLVGTGIVQMQNSLSSQFWLNQMPDYPQTNYTSDYAMIAAFTNGLNGCVLYNPAIFNSTSDDNVAQINLVTMLCAKYGAIALTPSEQVTLSNSQHITFPVLVDERTLATNNWTTIYTYALTNLAPGMQTGILHHLAGDNGTNFCILPVDYLVAQKIFTFNIPTNTTGTTTLQSNILALTASNTPVIGVWGLNYGTGEHGFVAQMTGAGKFVTVTYETGNLSYTTGLPMVTIPPQTNRPLVLNTNKNYIAFCQTDGDNYSFVSASWPLYLDVTNRLAYAFDWELCPAVNELNPVAAAWFYRNVGSTFVTPDAGIGYAANWNSINQNPQPPYLAPFLKLTDAYMGAMNQTFVRTIWTNYQSSLPWGALTHATGVHVAYTGTGISVSNAPSAAFISRGKAFFQGYDYNTQMTNIAKYAGSTPAFFSVGHEVGISSLIASIQTLPANFVVVSENELADLYRQYKTNDVLASQNILSAQFSPTAGTELLYLDEVEGAGTNATSGGSRFAHTTNYWVYQFNMNAGVTNVSAALTVYNNYQISACNDDQDWQVVAQAPGVVNNGSNIGTVTVNLTDYLGGPGNNLFLKFSDASPAQSGGVGLTYVQLISQGMSASGPVFTNAPQSETVIPGADVTFTGEASGTSPLVYQWFFNSTTLLPGATSTSLTLTNVGTNQTGAYTLVASNSTGTASATADLTVNEPFQGPDVVGEWPLNAGAGTNVANSSANTSNWGMTITGNPALWGYWQPGAYAFAQGDNNAETAVTAAAAWRSGDTLTITGAFNVTGNVHDSGEVFVGGAVFGGGYYVPGGNGQGFNAGAFYALVNTANPAAPTIEFDVASIAPGAWTQALPASVTDAGVNGGWNTAEWHIDNNVESNSMTLQFLLNGTNVGDPVHIAGGYLKDFTSYSGYTGSEFYIGQAAAQGYIAFQGSISNVSLVASIPSPALTVKLSGGYASLTLNGQVGFDYAIQYAEALTPNTWQTLTNLTLSSSPYTQIDPQPVANLPQRLYRAVVMP